ncbi:hypothetical protein Neosp_013311 [[Neocosmospora] mangrovei]
MADYYQNADVNIAEATESTDAGLFYERDGEANRPLHLPVTINTPDLPVKTRKSRVDSTGEDIPTKDILLRPLLGFF